MKKESNESGIGQVLGEIIKMNNLQAGIDAVNVKECWKRLMGNGVNSYTKDVILKNGTLYVQLSSSVLREELSFGKDKIIKLINDDLKREVVFQVILR